MDESWMRAGLGLGLFDGRNLSTSLVLVGAKLLHQGIAGIAAG